MSRITDIVANVRDTLADPSGNRWSDDRLIRSLNKGIKDIVNQTHCLKERIYVELEANAVFYDLSEFVLKFLHVQYMNKTITAKTHLELNAISSTWQEDIGTEVQYVTFDTLPEGYIRIYPMITDGLNVVVQNQVYGGIVDISVNDQIFQIPSLGNLEIGMEKYLVIHAVKKPFKVTIDTTDAEMEIDSMYDSALEYYITADVLRSDTDTLNRQFGAEQLQLFTTEIETNKNQVESVSSSTVKHRTISYTGFPS